MDITSLPYFTPLFKDYISRFDSSQIGKFFAIAPDAPREEMSRIVEARLAHERGLPPEHRQTIVASIAQTHAAIGEPSEAVLENLALLKSPDCVAVVTGQQLGVLGGPMYAFYKAFSAIQLAKKLSEEFPEQKFVPVFWLEGEDHDLEEVSSIHILNRNSEVETIRYVPSELVDGVGADKWKKQVGPILLEEERRAKFFVDLRAGLPQTGFTEEVLAVCERCYATGKTFIDAFAALLSVYFSDDGLLLFDAGSREVKALGRPLLHREIETSPALSEKVILQSVALEETYHAQVKPRALNLFYITDDGDRLLLMEHEKTPGQTERTFFLKGSRKTFTLAEIEREIDEQPERFSPNVVMRPLFQDVLLPTICYVAGPGEIAYFAQFRPGYEWAGIPMPLIQPRMSATIVEERLERTFEKFQLTPEEILLDGDGQNKTLLDAMIDSPLASTFESSIGQIDTLLESLRESVNGADATLDGALTSVKGKVLTTIRDFQNKTISAERKRHATTKAQLDKLLAALLPAGGLQERELNLVYFLNKYGMGFIDILKNMLREKALRFHEHHVLRMSESSQAPATNTD